MSKAPLEAKTEQKRSARQGRTAAFGCLDQIGIDIFQRVPDGRRRRKRDWHANPPGWSAAQVQRARGTARSDLRRPIHCRAGSSIESSRARPPLHHRFLHLRRARIHPAILWSLPLLLYSPGKSIFANRSKQPEPSPRPSPHPKGEVEASRAGVAIWRFRERIWKADELDKNWRVG